MSRLAEIEHPDHQELIFPCDCRDGDYLRITWDDDPEWRCLWIENLHRPRLRTRIRDAWRTLVGRPTSSGEVILTEESLSALVDFLTDRSSTQ